MAARAQAGGAERCAARHFSAVKWPSERAPERSDKRNEWPFYSAGGRAARVERAAGAHFGGQAQRSPPDASALRAAARAEQAQRREAAARMLRAPQQGAQRTEGAGGMSAGAGL